MPDLTRRQVVLVLTTALAAVAFALGIYGLVTGPEHRDGNASPTDADAGRPTSDRLRPSDTDRPRSTALPRTDDPVAYARGVAIALFGWDTATGQTRADVSAPVVADSDPSGQETTGLLTDIASYLPTDDQWADLTSLKVRQQLEIVSAVVPSDWPEIVASSRGQLNAGSSAVTISGIRARTGVWNGEHASSSYDVSFTVFMACPPAYDRCRLLRLSQLDNPLR